MSLRRRTSIVFLAHNIYGVGGTVRTVVNLANELSKTFDVSIASVFRRTEDPAFDIDKRVKLIPLVSAMGGTFEHRSHQTAGLGTSSLIHPDEELFAQYSSFTDSQLMSFVKSSSFDVYIGTRPGLNVFLAQHAPKESLVITQEHMNTSMIAPTVRKQMEEHYENVYAAVTVTEQEASNFSSSLALSDTRVVCIPNSIPKNRFSSFSARSDLIVAAGRLARGKRLEILLHAFSGLAADFPSWTLRVYGGGDQLAGLRALAHQLGLTDRVQFAGRVATLEGEWPKAKIVVSTSDAESFGMTLVEAMAAKAAVISTDCPVGPREIITDEAQGVLIPMGSTEELQSALRRLMVDERLRSELAKGGYQRSLDYRPEIISGQYRELISSGLTAQSRKLTANKKREHLDHPKLVLQLGRGTSLLVTGDLGKRSVLRKELLLQFDTITGKEFSVAHRVVVGRDGKFAVKVPYSVFKRTAHWCVGLFSKDGATIEAQITAAPQAMPDLKSRLFRKRVQHLATYQDENGVPRIRSWNKKEHVEVTGIQLNEQVYKVRCMSRNPLSASASLLVRRRGSLPGHFEVPITKLDEHEFSFSLDLDPLMKSTIESHEAWDLFLKDHGMEVRLARIFDDVAERKQVMNFPAVRGVRRGDSVSSPLSYLGYGYYTIHNELAIVTKVS